jgi:hypothetical protein
LPGESSRRACTAEISSTAYDFGQKAVEDRTRANGGLIYVLNSTFYQELGAWAKKNPICAWIKTWPELSSGCA